MARKKPRHPLAHYFGGGGHRLLVAVATASELEAVMEGLNADEPAGTSRPWQAYEFDALTVLHTGAGKANAAGAVASELMRARAENRAYAAVLSVGMAGLYPEFVDYRGHKWPIGTRVCCIGAHLVDEEIEQTPPSAGFLNLGAIEPTTTVFTVDNKVRHGEAIFWQALLFGTVNTVSTISGASNLDFGDWRRRTQACVEDTQTGAIAQVCHRHGIPWNALQVVSHVCGQPETLQLLTALASLTDMVRQWDFPPSSRWCLVNRWMA
jgi:nucleoside phosphorylase